MRFQLQYVGIFVTGRHAVLSYPVHATYHYRVMSLCSVTQEIREENHRNHAASHCVTFPFILLLVISKYSHLRFILNLCSRLLDCSVPVVFAPSSYLGGPVPNVCPETADSDGDLLVLWIVPYRHVAGYYLQLGNGRLLPHRLHFHIHMQSHHLTLYNMKYWQRW